MLYHQSYSDFQKRSFSWKMWKICIWAENFCGRSYFSFAMAMWKLLQRGNVKFPNSKLYTVSEKTLYHQIHLTDFQKLSFCGKMWKIGIWAEKIISAAILVLQWEGENFFQVEKIRNFPHSNCTLCQKNAISPKVFNRFSKTFLLLKDVKKRYLERKDPERIYFSFAKARWELFSGGN